MALEYHTIFLKKKIILDSSLLSSRTRFLFIMLLDNSLIFNGENIIDQNVVNPKIHW